MQPVAELCSEVCGCVGGPGENGCCPDGCASYVLLTAQGAASGRAVQVEPAMLLPAPLLTDCSQLGTPSGSGTWVTVPPCVSLL